MTAPMASPLQLSCSALNTIAALNAMDVHLQELGLYEGEKVSDTLASSDILSCNEHNNDANCTEKTATNGFDLLQSSTTAPACSVISVIKQSDESPMRVPGDETENYQLSNACNSPKEGIANCKHTFVERSTKVKHCTTPPPHGMYAESNNILRQRQSLMHANNTLSQAESEQHTYDVIAEANNFLPEEMSRSAAAFAANLQSKKDILECKERVTYLSHIAALQRGNELPSTSAVTNNTAAACSHSLNKSNRTCSLMLSDAEERQTVESNTRMQHPSPLTHASSSSTSSSSSSSSLAKLCNQTNVGAKNVEVDRGVTELCRWLVAGVVSVAIEVSDSRFLPVTDMYNKPVRRVTQDLSVSYWNRLIKEHLSLPSTESSTSLAEAKSEFLSPPSPLLQAERQQEQKEEESKEQNSSQMTGAQTHNIQDNNCMPELTTRETKMEECCHLRQMQELPTEKAIKAIAQLQEEKETKLNENSLPNVKKIAKEAADVLEAKTVVPDTLIKKIESTDEETAESRVVHDALEFMTNEALASDNILHNAAIDQVRVFLQNNLASCQANAIAEWRTQLKCSSNNNNNNINNKLRKCIMNEGHINGAPAAAAGWFVFGDRLSGVHLLRHLIEIESESEIANQLDLILAKKEATQEEIDDQDDDKDDNANKVNKMLSSSSYEVKRRYLTPKLLLQNNNEILRTLFTSLMSMTATTTSSSSSSPAMTSVANSSNTNINTNISNSNTTSATSTAAANTSMSGSLSFTSANNAGKTNHASNTKLMRGPASFHGKGSNVGAGGGSSNIFGLGNSINSSSFYHRSLATVLEILMNHEDVYYDSKSWVSNETETATRQSNNEINVMNEEVSHGANRSSHLHHRNSYHDEHSCDSSINSKGNTSHYDNEAAMRVYGIVADLLAKELICIYVRNVHTLSPQSVPECIMHEIDKPAHVKASGKESNSGAVPATTTTTTTATSSSLSSSSSLSLSRASQALSAVPSSRKSSRKQGNELSVSTHDVNNTTTSSVEATHDMRNSKSMTSTPTTKTINDSGNCANIEEHNNECGKKTGLECLIMVDFPRSVNFHTTLQNALMKRMNEMEIKIAGALQSAIQAEEEQAQFEANANLTAANDRRSKRSKLSSANDRTSQRPSSGMKTTLNENVTLSSSSSSSPPPPPLSQSRHNTIETHTSNSITTADISMPTGSNKGSIVISGSYGVNTNNNNSSTNTVMDSINGSKNKGSHVNEHDIRAAQLREISTSAYPPLLVGGLFLSYDLADRFNRLQELYMYDNNSNGDCSIERSKVKQVGELINNNKELQKVLERTYHNILCPESFQLKKEVSTVHANPVIPSRTLSMTRRSVVYQSGSALPGNTNIISTNSSSNNSGSSSSSNNTFELSTRKSTVLSSLHDNAVGSSLLAHNNIAAIPLSNNSTFNTHKEFLSDTWDLNTFRAVLTQQHHAMNKWRCAWEQCVNTDMMYNFIKTQICNNTHDCHLHHEAVPPLTEPEPSSTAVIGTGLHTPTPPIKSTARDGKVQNTDKHTRDNKKRLEKSYLSKSSGAQSTLPSKKTTCSLEEQSNTLHMNEMSGSMNSEKMITTFPRVVFVSYVTDCSNVLQVCKDKKKCSHINKDDEYEQKLRVVALIERKLQQTTMFANRHIKNETCHTNNTENQVMSTESVGSKGKENANGLLLLLLLSPSSLTINDYRLSSEALKEMLTINYKYSSQMHEIDVISNYKSHACFDISEDEENISNTNTQSLNEVKLLHRACLESEMKYERVFFVYLLQVLSLLQRKAFPLSLWHKSSEVFNATLFYTSIDGNFESTLEELEELTIETRHSLLCYGIQWMYNVLEVTRRVLLRAVSTVKVLSNCVTLKEVRERNDDISGENKEEKNDIKKGENNKKSLAFISSINFISLATELVKEMQSCTESHSCDTIMSNINCKLENEIKEYLSAAPVGSDANNSVIVTETMAKMIVQRAWSSAPLLLRTVNVLRLFMNAFRQTEQSANNWLKRMYNEVLTITPANNIITNSNSKENDIDNKEEAEIEAIRTFIAKLRPNSINDVFTKGIENLRCSKQENKTDTHVLYRTVDLDTLLVQFTLSNFCLYNSPHLSCGAFVRCVLLSQSPLLALLSNNNSKVTSAVTASTTIESLSEEHVSHFVTVGDESVDMEWNNLTVLPDLHEMICRCAQNFTLFAPQHTLLHKSKLPVHTVQELQNSVFHNVYKSQSLSNECFCKESELIFTKQWCSKDCTINTQLLLWSIVLSRLCYNSNVNNKHNLVCTNNCNGLQNVSNNEKSSASSAKTKSTSEKRRCMYDKYNYKAEEFMFINSSSTHNLRQALSHIKLTHEAVQTENGVKNAKLLDYTEVIPEALLYILQCRFTHNASLELFLTDSVSVDVLLQVATFIAPTWFGRVERLFHAIAALKQHERSTSCDEVDKLTLTADEVVYYFSALSSMLGSNTKVARNSNMTLTDDVRLLFSIDHVKDGLSLSKFMSSHWAQTLIRSQFRCKM